MQSSKGLTIFSWSLFDFANTIFSMNIVSLYFALWVTVDKGGRDILYSSALGISTLLIIFSLPILGILSDGYEQRMPFLIFFTLLSVIFTGLIGVLDHLFLGLIFFGIANYGYHSSLVFYDALLPQVAGEEKHLGKVSGYGVAMGYLGAILGLLMVKPFVLRGGRSGAFIPTAVLFLLFSLPCFFVVKDAKEKKIDWGKIHHHFFAAVKKLINTFVNAKKYPAVFTFLLANFIYSDATNTIIVFMAVYTKKVIQMTDTQIVYFLITSTSFAVVGSYFCGFICDRIGPRKTLISVLLGWCFTLSLAVVSFSPFLFWFVGPLAGICLGSVWVSARALLVKVSPTEKLGEFFGLYGLTEKFATVIGPLIWGLTVLIFEPLGIIRYRIAVGMLLFFMCCGLFVLTKVPEEN